MNEELAAYITHLCELSGHTGQVLWSGVIVLCPSGWVMR